MRRILLCGATGHLGTHIIKQLGSSGHLVRALVRTEQQSRDLLGFAHEVHRGDLLQASTLDGACAEVDTIVSAAGASVHLNVRGRDSFGKVDLDGHRNLLASARRAGVRKFVYVSVLSTPALLETSYVKSKETFAAELAASGMDHHILRPTGFFSAFSDLITMARQRGSLPLMGDGSARTNPIDDEEVAAACLEALDSTETHRAIGGPDILTRKQIFDLVFEAIGRKPKYQRIPQPIVAAGAKLARLANPRMADLTNFYLALSRHDAVAPQYGNRRLSEYLKMYARFS